MLYISEPAKIIFWDQLLEKIVFSKNTHGFSRMIARINLNGFLISALATVRDFVECSWKTCSNLAASESHIPVRRYLGSWPPTPRSRNSWRHSNSELAENAECPASLFSYLPTEVAYFSLVHCYSQLSFPLYWLSHSKTLLLTGILWYGLCNYTPLYVLAI